VGLYKLRDLLSLSPLHATKIVKDFSSRDIYATATSSISSFLAVKKLKNFPAVKFM